jgi:hypothetical protein
LGIGGITHGNYEFKSKNSKRDTDFYDRYDSSNSFSQLNSEIKNTRVRRK